MHSDMETAEFEQAGYESSDGKSDHGESHNWAGMRLCMPFLWRLSSTWLCSLCSCLLVSKYVCLVLSGFYSGRAHKDTSTHTTDNKRKRKRRITWYNPPYSHNTTTNIGKKFLDILDTCFPHTHKLHRLLNRNTVKLSCSCMPNMKQIIASHNKTLINTKNTKPITKKL